MNRPRARVFGEHSSRRDSLLGYTSYAKYLASPEWRAIRTAVFSERPNCELCGSSADQVHHHSYDPMVMAGAMNHLLVSVCNSCHMEIEFDGAVKIPHYQARGKIIKLLNERGNRETRGRLWKAGKIIKALNNERPLTRGQVAWLADPSGTTKPPPRQRVKKKRFH